MARRKKAKKLSLLNRVKAHLVNAKKWVLDHVDDHDFLPAMIWLGLGSVLVFKCLDPWMALGLPSMLIGGKKLWDIARW